MRILFLNPPLPDGDIYMKELGRCGRRSVGGETWPQTGLAYLAAVALREGQEARVLDGMAEGLTQDQAEARILEWLPDWIITGTTTPTFRQDALFLRTLKGRHGFTVGFTGTHVTALPRECLLESNSDFIFISEAELTLQRLIHAPRDHWQDVPGVCVNQAGEARLGPATEMVANLDDLPYPARNLTPWQLYRMPFSRGEPFATVIPSRGCPYPCTFCRAGSVWGRGIRTRSVENLLGELVEMKEQLGINFFAFMTDTFTLRKTWVHQVMEAMRPYNFRWVCNSRVDTIDPVLAREMKASGCELISFGVESGNEQILASSKKDITLKQIREGISAAKEAGILTFAYFILGLPGENPETIEDTIRFARELDPDYCNFHIATPFPGTELYEEAKANGWLVHENWEQYEEMGSAVLRTPYISPEALLKAQRRATRSLYLRPKRILAEMKRLRSFQDLVLKGKAALRLLGVTQPKTTLLSD
ncbi:MAG: radical SAM protein [Candidatus Omnitrophica bacterium COP1]|nr:radical SAM protein [Candidatus Omnitrophica bacterium COP1]